MKKTILFLFAAVFIGFTLYSVEGNAQMGQEYGPGYGTGSGMMGQGYNSGYVMGGPGMMGSGSGMGQGMMGSDNGYDRQYGPQYGRQYQQQPRKPLDRNQAKQEAENYLRSMRNPNLKLGRIQENSNGYQVNIVTKDGSLVDKVLVDKNTGGMRSTY
ncbi:MAG: hypothetical protein WB792_11895 [Desulfobacterales bacterium]